METFPAASAVSAVLSFHEDPRNSEGGRNTQLVFDTRGAENGSPQGWEALTETSVPPRKGRLSVGPCVSEAWLRAALLLSRVCGLVSVPYRLDPRGAASCEPIPSACQLPAWGKDGSGPGT